MAARRSATFDCSTSIAGACSSAIASDCSMTEDSAASAVSSVVIRISALSLVSASRKMLSSTGFSISAVDSNTTGCDSNSSTRPIWRATMSPASWEISPVEGRRKIAPSFISLAFPLTKAWGFWVYRASMVCRIVKPRGRLRLETFHNVSPTTTRCWLSSSCRLPRLLDVVVGSAIASK